MLGTNEEFVNKCIWWNVCLFAAGPAPNLCCSTLPDIPLYLKSHFVYSTQCHVYVIGLFHLHTCKLIKSTSLCTVDLSIATFRFKAYINFQMFDSWPLYSIYCHLLSIFQTSLHHSRSDFSHI